MLSLAAASRFKIQRHIHIWQKKAAKRPERSENLKRRDIKKIAWGASATLTPQAT